MPYKDAESGPNERGDAHTDPEGHHRWFEVQRSGVRQGAKPGQGHAQDQNS
jgi:hypothetical protein